MAINPLMRNRLTLKFSEQLDLFSRDTQRKFACPTCLNLFQNLSSEEEITTAHIIPESAGGNKWTVLCRKCNSEFGRKQDYWLGEYLKRILGKHEHQLHCGPTPKHIKINGKKVYGSLKILPQTKSIELICYKNRNPPNALDFLDSAKELEIYIPIEIFKHQEEVTVGYLTAAYLLWFNAIGYNWTHQSHLEEIRKQIKYGKTFTNRDFFLISNLDKLYDPCIVIALLNGFPYPACLIYDKAVIFSAPPESNIPNLRNLSINESEIDYLKPTLAILNHPYGIACDNHVIILPDMIDKDVSIPEFLLNMPSDPDKDAEWFTMS